MILPFPQDAPTPPTPIRPTSARRLDFLHNPYRQLTTRDLKANLESRLWERAEIAADLEEDPASWAFGHANLEFVDVQIELVVAELTRRDRLRRRAGAPSWPNGHPDLTPVIAAIKETLPIDTYLETRRVRVNRYRADRASCLCPLPGHDDSTASFAIDLGKRLFYCHGCATGGDVLRLHQHLTGETNFVRVVEDLAREAGVDMQGGRHGRN